MRRLSAILLLLLSGVLSAQVPLSNLTATWNNAATTFNAIKMDITNTASAAGSSALWLGFSGTQVFRVDKDGTIYASAVAMPTISSIDILSNKTLTLPQINDTSSDHQYVFAVNELVADRTVTLPLLTGNDTFAFNDFAATLTNKTIVAANNTLTLFAGGANNQLLTDDGSGGLVSESGLFFDGTDFGVNTTSPNALVDVRGAAGGPGIQELSTAETTVVDGDELGRINFRAPDDAAGGDANLIAAAIYAEADATFSSSVNNTELVFATGESETATEKMRLTADGRLGLGTASPASPVHAFGTVNSASGGSGPVMLLESDSSQIDFSGFNNFGHFELVNSNQTANTYAYFGFSDNAGGGFVSALFATRFVDHANNYGDFYVATRAADGMNIRMMVKSAGEVGINNTTPSAQLDVTAPASTVGFNVDLDATPGSALTITNSSSNVLFEIDSTGNIRIADTSADHDYVFAVSELVADRTVTLPLLTGNDTFVFAAHAQTLTNKTIVAANNTLTLFSGGANNQLLTDDGSGGLVSESGLVFDGTKLGIGVSNPEDVVHVKMSSGNAILKVESVTDNAIFTMDSGTDGAGVEQSTLLFRANGTNKWQFSKDTSDRFTIHDYTRAQNVLLIEDGGDMSLMGSGGKVGIGNDNPSSQLDITAATSTVGLNIDLDATPGDAFTVTNSGAATVFSVNSSGEISAGGAFTAQSLTPDSNSDAGSTINDQVVNVDVGAVTTNADDWIVLPSLANVPVGHEIKIACNAGTNFELRTPATSNELINTVDSDATQEYLCTDTELIRIYKVSATDGWVASALTALGAVATAVVPD